MTPELQQNTPQKAPKGVFLAAAMVFFFMGLSAADSVGFVPCYFDGTQCGSSAAGVAQEVSLSELPQLGVPETPAPTPAATPAVLPERLVIDSIGLDLPVQNPDTRDIEALDQLLQNGPARYVDSARLGENGNVLLFAHSSHLPIVHNKMFQAFNHISELKAGDSITLYGGGRAYLYSVTRVAKADVSDVVDLSRGSDKLTLVTCDTLTGKSARFILEADFVGSFGSN